MDRIRPLKMESPATGGTQDDEVPYEVEPNQDYADLRGITLQNDSSNDEDVVLSRDASDNMTFMDKVVSGTKTLSDLLAGADFDTVLTSRNTGQVLVSRNTGNILVSR